jgi:hypothetical protein
MNLRNLFRVISVLHLITGVVWLLAPRAMPTSYGMDIEAHAVFLYQQLGAINIAFAVLFFLVSGMAPSPARQAVVTFVVVLQSLSAIAYIASMLNGSLPSTGWFGFALSLVMALAFGYFRFIRPERSLSPGMQT